MVEVTKAVRAVAEAAGPRAGTTLLALENEAMEAARFLTHCTVRRAYATVEKVDDGGTLKAVPLVKVELRFRGPKYAPGQRTLLWKGGPPLEQLLRSMGWPDPHAGELAKALMPELGARQSELEGEMSKHVEALKGDPAAVEAVREEVRAAYEAQRSKHRDELATTFQLLLRCGWTEEEVLKVWREEQCRTVQES